MYGVIAETMPHNFITEEYKEATYITLFQAMEAMLSEAPGDPCTRTQ